MATTETQQIIKKTEVPVVEMVLSRVTELEKVGGLTVPPDYSVANALRSAWFVISETKDKAGLPATQVCTKDSIYNSLLNMTVQGLNPMKKQCSFIVRGNKLTLIREVGGSITLARRFGGIVDVKPVVIYKDDVFKYEIDPKTGRINVLLHEQVLENISEEKVRGSYAVVSYPDGTFDTFVMTMEQIRTSWEQGELKGKGPAHIRFTSAMCRKTIVHAACKYIINSSDDSGMIDKSTEPEGTSPYDATEVANKGEVIDISEEEIQTAQEVVEEPAVVKTEGKKETEKAPF